MAALDTYAKLSTSVFSRLNRDAVTADFDDALALTEAEVNRRLALNPVRPMHTRATAPITTEFLAVPSGIIDVDSMDIDGAPILATSPQNMQALISTEAADAQPEYYAQIGGEFRFFPAPDTTYTVNLTYWGRVPALTNVATSNWLLLAHPDVYFHGVLAHLYQQYFDTPNADAQAALFDLAIQKVLDAYPKRVDKMPLRSDISPSWLSGWKARTI